MLEGGLILKWERMNWPSDDKCSLTATGNNEEHRVVTIADIQGSFWILFFGKFTFLTVCKKKKVY